MNKIGKIRSIKERKTANDVLYTPLEVAIKLIEMTETLPSDFLLDPSKGGGIFFENFPTCIKKEYCEITEGKDFFDYEGSPDIIIGNPPYSLWTAWIKKTIALNPRKIAYVFGMLNLTPIRLKLLEDNGYHLIKLHITTVKGWFANCLLAVFERDKKPIITFDTKRHKL